MQDLISRQAAIDAIRKIYDSVGILGEKWAVDKCQMAIKDLPSAQPERQRGEWIEISSINHTYKCSECGRLLVNITDGRNNVSKHYPYCHCGADMRGESE